MLTKCWPDVGVVVLVTALGLADLATAGVEGGPVRGFSRYIKIWIFLETRGFQATTKGIYILRKNLLAVKVERTLNGWPGKTAWRYFRERRLVGLELRTREGMGFRQSHPAAKGSRTSLAARRPLAHLSVV